MRMLLIASAAVAAFALVACGSEADPPSQKEFDHGTAFSATGGASGSTSYSYQQPTFTNIAYPPPPYGTQMGSVMQDFEFWGWKKPADAKYDIGKFEKVRLADFHDPDGSKGIKLIMMNASAVWCSVCRAEYQWLDTNGTYAQYKAKGVEFVGTIFEDNANPPKPAKPGDLKWWGEQYDVEFPLLVDPGFKLGTFFTADATPMNLIIDAKNMVIIAKILGGDITSVLAKLDQNL